MPADYLNDRNANRAPRYVRWIATKLQPFFGGKKVLTVPIEARSREEAKEKARALAVQHDKEFAKLRALPPDRAAALIAAGGVSALEARRKYLESEVAEHAPEDFILDQAMQPDLSNVLIGLPPPAVPHRGPVDIPEITEEFVRRGMLEMLQRQRREIAELAEVKALQGAPAPEYTLDGLFELWVRVREPKITRSHKRAVGLLKAFLGGNVDYRTVTDAQCRAFCDDMVATGSTKLTAMKTMDCIRGMFNAAKIRRERPDNPAIGIKPDGKIAKAKKKPFTGEQLKTILARAESTRFGGPKRHVETLWLLRLAVYTGARINEIAQLRREDVRVEAGVPLIEFREGHREQSIKTGEARKVPLHPATAGFLAYAQTAKGEFIFGVFPHDKNNGRAATLISTFGKFLRETCEIADTNLTLHSMRKRFADACIVAGLSAVSSRVLIGHAGADVHSKVYETGPGLRLLAQDVAKLDPLGAD